jgi:hypothetical protein
MKDSRTLGPTCGRLFEIGRTTAVSGHFQVTFRALMAAAHCAEDYEETGRLGEAAVLL